MSKQWVVGKVTSPLGTPFVAYLRHPRRNGVEVWDEEHDVKLFTFWEACWQALRHWGSWPMHADMRLYR